MTETILTDSFFSFFYCLFTDCTLIETDGISWWPFILAGFIVSFLISNIVLIAVILLIWFERRALGRFHNRTGPNRWGPFGLLTPVADAVKVMFKEDISPSQALKIPYRIAPVLMMFPTLLVFSVIPFGDTFFIADINVAVLFILGITSISTLAIMLAGWSSRNRISIFSSIRAVAILLSYEIPAALSLVTIVMLAGSMSLQDIVIAQDVPFIIVQPIAFLVFFISSLAEMNRAPFDLVEAESELAAGHLNDYSSMKFGLLFITEFMAPLVGGSLITIFFLSGWRGPDFIYSPIWFAIKLTAVLGIIVWIRATLPRLRIDQVLNLSWKGLFEITLLNIVLNSLLLSIFPQPTYAQLWIIASVNWVALIVIVVLFSMFYNSNRRRRKKALPKFAKYPVAVKEWENR